MVGPKIAKCFKAGRSLTRTRAGSLEDYISSGGRLYVDFRLEATL